MALHYATFNRYGSETSTGLDNTVEVFAFLSRWERDRFVSDTCNHNLSVHAISSLEAKRIIRPRPDGKREWKTTGGGFIIR